MLKVCHHQLPHTFPFPYPRRFLSFLHASSPPETFRPLGVHRFRNWRNQNVRLVVSAHLDIRNRECMGGLREGLDRQWDAG
jgi:hypothetical protein